MNQDKIFTALVVDDDENILRLTQRALGAVSFRADIAANGVIASEMLAKHDYDALITDLRMPKKHGHQLIAEVMDKPGDRPLIFVVTGLIEPRLALDLFERGVDSIDYKPFHFAAFAAKVRGLVEHRRSHTRRDTPILLSTPAVAPDATAAQLRESISGVTKGFEDAIKKLKEQQAQLENGYLGSMRMLTGLVGNIGKSKGVHASRVERMAAYIGERCGMPQATLRNIRIAALLHEIGQFGMPDTIRGKAAWHLPADIREQYEKYPTIGAALLSEMPGTEEIVRLVECHAENFDGTGFPNRLQGEAIPLGARIIRLADAYDTYLMFLDPGQTREDAIHYLVERKGKIHDPDLFKHAMAFIEDLVAEESTKKAMVVNSSELCAGMELAENVYDEEGRFLARENVVLTPDLSDRLRRLLKNQSVHVFVEK